MSDGRLMNVVIGGARLLMHNGQLADRLNPHAKALSEATSKSKKSDDDLWEAARLEFVGSLYIDEKLGPYIPGENPGENLSKMLAEGAKKKKRGRDFPGVSVVEEMVPLQYDGPRTVEALWADARFRDRRGAVLPGKRIQRTRPKFRDWQLAFTIEILPGVPVNPAAVEEALTDAGMFVGLGDWRPGSPRSPGRWGIFRVIKFEEIKDIKAPRAKRAAA